MRLRVFALPRVFLLFFGLTPLILWAAFHPQVIFYPDFNSWSIIALGVSLSLISMELLRRGVFSVRYVIFICVSFVLFLELAEGVLDRDFGKLGMGLGSIFAFVYIASRLELKVASAHLNPEVFWFEGAPKYYREVKARVKLGEVWHEAKLRRIDEKGLFFIFQSPVEFKKGQDFEFEMGIKSAEVNGVGRVSAAFYGENLGLGLQFLAKDLYHFSQYTAFVQQLKGRGL